MATIRCETCDHDRRDFLKKVGKTGIALGFMGMSLGSRNFLQQAYGATPSPTNAFFDNALQVFFSGGPSQTDTWDVKPGSPNNVFNTINLGIPDAYGNNIQISDVFPKLAALVMNNPNVSLGIYRSMVHRNNNHGTAQSYMNNFWEGALNGVYPSTAAAMTYFYQSSAQLGIPSVVINGNQGDDVNTANASRVATALQVNANSGQGANPIVEALNLPAGVDATRYQRRKALLDKLNARYLLDRPDDVAKAYETALTTAADITIKGDAARAFDLTGVPLLPARDNGTAQRLTQAHRLLESGIPYVSVGIGGNDSHGGNMNTIRQNWGASFDDGISEMINRILPTGKKTLICAGGEFGRTPNTTANGRDGRDHWGDGFSWVMIGVNQPKMKTTAYGQTGPDGMFRERDGNLVDPVHPRDYGAVVYRALGFPTGLDVNYDLPLNDRMAPAIDRVNIGGALMTNLGLV